MQAWSPYERNLFRPDYNMKLVLNFDSVIYKMAYSYILSLFEAQFLFPSGKAKK